MKMRMPPTIASRAISCWLGSDKRFSYAAYEQATAAQHQAFPFLISSFDGYGRRLLQWDRSGDGACASRARRRQIGDFAVAVGAIDEHRRPLNDTAMAAH
jgi:hypothetical protein